jgi:hypothetical protein
MKYFFLLLGLILNLQLSAQVDHWETVVQEDDLWQYRLGTSAPPANWTSLEFNGNDWSVGPGGFGYSDGDDNTIVPTTISLYIRRTFTVEDLSKIESAILDVDYDDSFVAYLNGQEIARANIEGTPPGYLTTANTDHEAQLYNGGLPDRFFMTPSTLFDLLQPGDNLLAIQVHNVGSFSSDLTIRPFLSVGINDDSFTYYHTPDWFEPPVDINISELPIVVINTNGQEIVNEPDILCEFGIIYNGPGATNHLSDPWNEYDGFAKIEIRGESSQFFDKKSYAVETSDANGEDLDASFLNFPEEEDWVLYGPFSDKTLIRNVLIMKMGQDMGRYNSRTRLVEVFINSDYKGVYVLMEKIKRDKNRLDIAKLKTTDIEGEELTGGYLFRIDKGWHPGWESNFDVVSAPGVPIRFQYRYPDPDSIQPEQEVYIQTYVDDFERAIANPFGYINNLGYHYTHYIDLESFVDNFIANEVSRNLDGYRLSTYFYKDKNSKIVAGPLWDFNLSFGNGDYCNGQSYTGWMYEEYCDNGNPFWWENMLEDSLFLKSLKCRWRELRESSLNTGYLLNYIDSLAAELEAPAQRNFTRWPILGTYVWPNPWPYPDTYQGEITTLKLWLINRLGWIDGMINPIEVNCEGFNPTSTNAIGEETDPLVISPNPTTGHFQIKITPEMQQSKQLIISLYDLSGRLVFQNIQEDFPTENIHLDLTKKLDPGMYFIEVKSKSDGGKRLTGKVIVL